MREYQALGTAGGLYHFRDTILRGSPDQIFVLHSDIVCSYVRPLKPTPLRDMTLKTSAAAGRDQGNA